MQINALLQAAQAALAPRPAQAAAAQPFAPMRFDSKPEETAQTPDAPAAMQRPGSKVDIRV